MAIDQRPDWLVSSDSCVPQASAATPQFFTDLYRMYGQNFWRFYKLTVPPTLLAFAAYTLRPILVSMITSGTPGREISRHPGVIAAMGLANFGTFFLVWFFEAFTFAAITEVVGALYQGTDIPDGDGYTGARERIWKIVEVSIATYLPFIFGFLCLLLLSVVALVKLHDSSWLGHYWATVTLVSFEMFLCFTALVGFAFAIPIIMTTNEAAGTALKASWRLTNRHEGKLIIFVAESLIGAVVVMYATALASYLVFNHVSPGRWGVWAVAIAEALAGAPVQAPMLIAFALLYFTITEPRAATLSSTTTPPHVRG